MPKNNMQDELNKYYNEINRLLPIKKVEKKKFIRDLKDSADEYLKKNEGITYQEFLTQFGTPESIVITFMEQENSEETVKRAMQKRKMKILIITSLCIIMLLSLLAYGYAVYDTYRTNHGYFEEELISEQ